ncbi:hypothetical protein ACVFI8_10920 [Agarivorans sp. MS3-6]
MFKKTKSSPFGTLANVRIDGSGNLVIINVEGRTLVMTTKYPQLEGVALKALRLVGRETTITTSQTTAEWSTMQWFCDISAA